MGIYFLTRKLNLFVLLLFCCEGIVMVPKKFKVLENVRQEGKAFIFLIKSFWTHSSIGRAFDS